MNEYKIILRRVGYSNTILIVNGSNSILIDTGVKGNMFGFEFLFDQFDLTPEDIKLIILTHTHYDHTGNLKELVELTGARVMVHKNEFENLKKGYMPIPRGTQPSTKIIAGLGKIVYPKFASPRPFEADIVNEDEMSLYEFGIEGKVISTPGHTNGSQSVLLGDKLIAGDAYVNFQNGKVFPPFANDPTTLLQTWQHIYNLGVKEIFPAHGQKLLAKDTVEEFKRWKKKLGLDIKPETVLQKEYSFETRS